MKKNLYPAILKWCPIPVWGFNFKMACDAIWILPRSCVLQLSPILATDCIVFHLSAFCIALQNTLLNSASNCTKMQYIWILLVLQLAMRVQGSPITKTHSEASLNMGFLYEVSWYGQWILTFDFTLVNLLRLKVLGKIFLWSSILETLGKQPIFASVLDGNLRELHIVAWGAWDAHF